MSKTKIKTIKTKQTESQIIRAIAEDVELSLSDVKAVFASLNGLVASHMKKGGSGEFKIPQLGVKIKRVKRAARKAREGRNPLTGETIMIAAKPACQVIKATILKALKEVIA